MRVVIIFAIALLVALALTVLRGRKGPGLNSMLRGVREVEDLDPVIAQAAGMSPSARSLFYQRAIASFWGEYKRAHAIRLIRAFSEVNSVEKIAQYWIKQALEVEPLLARKEMGADFLKVHYNPTVAKQCGLTGS